MTDTGAELYSCFQFLHSLRHHYYGRANKVTPSGRLQTAVVVLLSDALILCSNRGGLHRYIPLGEISKVVHYQRGRILIQPEDGASCGNHALLLSFIGCDKLVRQMSLLYAGLCGRDLQVVHERDQPDVGTLMLRPISGAPATVPNRLIAAVRLANVQSGITSVDRAARAAKEAVSHENIPLPEDIVRERQGAAAVVDAAQVAQHGRPFVPRHFTVPEMSVLSNARKISVECPLTIVPDTLGICVATSEGGRQVITFPCFASLWVHFQKIEATLPGAKQHPMTTLKYVGCPQTPPALLVPIPTADAYDSTQKETPSRQSLSTVVINTQCLRSLMEGYSIVVPHSVTVQRFAFIGGNPVTSQEESGLFWSGA